MRCGHVAGKLPHLIRTGDVDVGVASLLAGLGSHLAAGSVIRTGDNDTRALTSQLKRRRPTDPPFLHP